MPIIAKSIPTDNPSGTIICWDNFLQTSDDTDADNALEPNTYNRWRPSSGAFTVRFQLGANRDINCIGIGAHDLVGETVLISTAETEGGALTDVESISPLDNSAILIDFETRNVEEIAISGTLIAGSEVGVVYASEALQMERNIYGGHSPINLSQKTEFQTALSDTGQTLGATITKKGLETTYDWQFLEPDFYREKFQPFVKSASAQIPFFIKWRPDKFSNEVALGHTTSDIQPVNMGGGHELMSVSISVRGHADV